VLAGVCNSSQLPISARSVQSACTAKKCSQFADQLGLTVQMQHKNAKVAVCVRVVRIWHAALNEPCLISIALCEIKLKKNTCILIRSEPGGTNGQYLLPFS
jgi:hypothetical protein